MPCYDPPPPYEGDARKNAEQAASILCQLINGRLNQGMPLSPILLSWYLEHRNLDVLMLPQTTVGMTPEQIAEKLLELEADIDRTRRRLALALS